MIRLRDNPAPIEVTFSFLQVASGQEFNLIGGDINLDSSFINAPGGAIELGGLAVSGDVAINDDGSLNFPGQLTKTDISLNNGTTVNVAADIGGSINVTANNLEILDGSNLLSGITSGSQIGQVQAGNITVNATSITLDGTTPDGQNSSGIGSTVNQGAVGNGGGIEVTTDELSINNGANINVSNLGEGNSGNLLVKASALTLNGGGIFAANIPSESNAANETSVLGGNITLEIADNLILRNNSSISAQAGENASGGNINIDADFVIAFSSSGDGNDIIASAEQGAGGRINISTQQIFGLVEREAVPGNNTNDIDATSDFGLDGTVNISTFTDDLLQGAAELPANPVEPEQTVTQACQSDRASGTSGTLTILGKGGVPPEPVAPLNSDVLIIEGDATTATNSAPQVIKTAQGDIVPARGVEITEDGRVLLVAYPTSNDRRTPAARTNCGT